MFLQIRVLPILESTASSKIRVTLGDRSFQVAALTLPEYFAAGASPATAKVNTLVSPFNKTYLQF